MDVFVIVVVVVIVGVSSTGPAVSHRLPKLRADFMKLLLDFCLFLDARRQAASKRKTNEAATTNE